MARVYAIEENSKKRHLIRLECDYPNCSSIIKPGDTMLKSNWTKQGIIGTYDSFEHHYCPEHS